MTVNVREPAPTGRGYPGAARRAPPVPWRRAAHGVLGEDARAVRRRLRGQRCQGLRAVRPWWADGGPGTGRRGGAEKDLARGVRGRRDTRGSALTPSPAGPGGPAGVLSCGPVSCLAGRCPVLRAGVLSCGPVSCLAGGPVPCRLARGRLRAASRKGRDGRRRGVGCF